MIVGSRLQAITASAIALAIAVALVGDEPIWVVPCIVLWLFAVSRMMMRTELHTDRASWRTWRGSRSAQRAELSADMGHRYLQLAAPTGRIKIEVPVEIRPNVRDWVDAQPLETEPPATRST